MSQQETVRAIEASYNALPYHGGTQPNTHPSRLEAFSKLYGGQPASVKQCRVLELGCAQGLNLIPLAFHFPQSEFIGLDLAQNQIDSGNAMIEALGLKNIRLMATDFSNHSLGSLLFDYIIAHGLFSWIPQALQETLLQTCKELLSPQGLCYISYNTYPGWKLQEPLRDMALYHSKQGNLESDAIAKETRKLFDALDYAYAGNAAAINPRFSEEKAKLNDRADGYIMHDLLSIENNPIYYHQFNTLCKKIHLQHLGDAEEGRDSTQGLPQATQNYIRDNSPNTTVREQYADFFTNRRFRRSILCHDNITLSDAPIPSVFLELQLLSPLKPEAQSVRLENGYTEKFCIHSKSLSTDLSIAKAALIALADAYPASLSFEQLLGKVDSLLTQSGSQLTPDMSLDLCAFLATNNRLNSIELLTTLPESNRLKNDFPTTTTFIRWLAANQCSIINLHHKAVKLSDEERSILQYLDGLHDKKQIGKASGFSKDKIDACLVKIEASALLI